MKNTFRAILLLFLGFSGVYGQNAKIISECTVLFAVSAEDSKADKQVVNSMSGATKVVYIKGSKSRSDLITSAFKQTTLKDTKSDTTVILRELGNTKYISYLFGKKKQDQTEKYAGVEFINQAERKTILGYDCIKVIAKLTNGSTYNVFYTTAITPSNNEYEYQFKDLAGFVLEYEGESTDGKTKIKYSAQKITLLPVPAAIFDLPKSGYRVL